MLSYFARRCARGAQRLFFLRKTCVRVFAGSLRAGFCGRRAGCFFFARLMGRGVLRELFLRFRLKRAAIFSGAWLPCGGVVFFASHCLLRGSLLGGCAQCALRRVKICARTFFSRDFFAPCGSGAMNLGGILILWLAGAPAVFLRRLFVAISMVRTEDFGIILQTFLRAFFRAHIAFCAILR